MTDETTTPAEPLLTVVAGDPTPEELAALTAVVAARRAAASAHQEPAPATSQWAARERLTRRTLFAGPGAWRASAWPR